MALEAVARVAHRGAASTDNSGDGAGLLTQIPQRLFYRDAYRLGLRLEAGRPFARRRVLPARSIPRPSPQSVLLVERVLAEDGLPLHRLARRAGQPGGARRRRAAEPAGHPAGAGGPARALVADEDAWERALFLARRAMEQRAEALGLPGFYVPSLSCRTIVYKALLHGHPAAGVLSPTSAIPEFESAVAVFHQRYSTNTLPSWPLAQPFRLLAHNGEINTLWGNRNAMTMRTADAQVTALGRREDRALKDVVWPHGSDSASLDNAMELFVRSGRDPVHTTMMMIPQAWEKYPDVDPAMRPSTSTTSPCMSRGTAPRPSRSPTGGSPAPRWTATGSAPAATRSGTTASSWWAPRWAWWTSTRDEVIETARSGPARCSWSTSRAAR